MNEQYIPHIPEQTPVDEPCPTEIIWQGPLMQQQVGNLDQFEITCRAAYRNIDARRRKAVQRRARVSGGCIGFQNNDAPDPYHRVKMGNAERKVLNDEAIPLPRALSEVNQIRSRLGFEAISKWNREMWLGLESER